MNDITCVSGWWSVKNKFNGGSNAQVKHMNKTLRLKAPFVFLYDDDDIKSYVESIRNSSLKTEYIKMEIKEFLTYKYYPRLKYGTHMGGWCPSKELWLIWMEKISLCLKALKEGKINTQWLCWYDATMSKYRIGKLPLPNNNWPNEDKMKLLDKNKINCTIKEGTRMNKGEWPPLVTGTFIFHVDYLPIFADKFYNVVDYLFNKIEKKEHTIIGTDQFSDQYPLTYLCHTNPELFNPIGKGFGAIIDIMK